ncbi:MAG: hypothetical protein ACFFDH_08730 [Promethearchaeota archaeon]
MEVENTFELYKENSKGIRNIENDEEKLTICWLNGKKETFYIKDLRKGANITTNRGSMQPVSTISNLSLKHPSVQRVIEIAEEIVEENKKLTIDNLYYRAKRILRIPRKGLKAIIQYLVNKKIIVNQSRFTKKSILAHPLREAIYSFIKDNLGVHLSTIRKNFQSENIGTGQLLWHLKMLLKFNYVKSIKLKNYLLFLPIEIDDEIGIINFFLRNDLNFRIVKLLLGKKEFKRTEIYKNLAESRELVYYHLNNLIEHNLIELMENKSAYINPKKVLLIESTIINLEHVSKYSLITTNSE